MSTDSVLEVTMVISFTYTNGDCDIWCEEKGFGSTCFSNSCEFYDHEKRLIPVDKFELEAGKRVIAGFRDQNKLGLVSYLQLEK